MNLAELKARARELARQQDFGSESRSVNVRILELQPTSVDARTRLGRCYEQREDWGRAVEQYEAALRLDPGNSIAASRLGNARVQLHFPRVDLAAAGRHRNAARFEGFELIDFAELATSRQRPEAAFAKRFNDIGQSLNALPFAAAVQDLRGSKGGLFRRGMTFGQRGHVYTYHWGGRWEAQCNIGMFAATHWAANLVRAGIGFNLTLQGRDPNARKGQELALRRFAGLQQALKGSLGPELSQWLGTPGRAIQFAGKNPAFHFSGEEAVSWLLDCRSPAKLGWVFIGTWFKIGPSSRLGRDEFLTLANQTFTELLEVIKAAQADQ